MSTPNHHEIGSASTNHGSQPEQPPTPGWSAPHGSPPFGADQPTAQHHQPAPSVAGHPHPGQPYPGQPNWGQPYQEPQYQGQPYQGQAWPSGYPNQPYAGPPWPAFGGAWAAPARPDYAHWGRRVGAYAIDFAPGLIGAIFLYAWYFGFIFRMYADLQDQEVNPFNALSVTPTLVIGLVLVILAYGFDIYNRFFRGGRTGQTLGKRVLKITLVSELSGEPIGALNAFLRDLLHYLDGAAYVGFLWPLWDDKRQTFADKLMRTVVLNVRTKPDQSS